jgi:hypothetical protein
MTRTWWLIGLAVGFSLAADARVATPQTVIVRGAAPGSTIEVMLNSTRTARESAGPGGDATLAVGLAADLGRTETDVAIFIDACVALRRVLLVERGTQPPAAEPGCSRTAMSDSYRLLSVTTLVVNVGQSNPVVRIRQGPAPPAWLGLAPLHADARSVVPSGFMVFGGAGIGALGELKAVACGSASACTGADARGAMAVGAIYWVTPFLGVEASFLRPGTGDVRAAALAFSADSTLETRVLTIAGKVGAVAGRARFYGTVGANRHAGAFQTTELVESVVSGDDGGLAIDSGEWASGFRTRGWGWLLGGGAEVWMTPRIGIYAEVGRVALKGASIDGGEGALDDKLTVAAVGLRIPLGR